MTEEKYRKKLKGLTTGKLIKKLEPIFNKFIRQRDEGKPCISCGEYKELTAGHFFPVKGYSGIRFMEDNVHGECVSCNGQYNGDHLIGYTENLPKKIGKERYEKVKEAAAEYKKNQANWSRPELVELIIKYKYL